MDERKSDHAYSRYWRPRLPLVKLKTRAWITWTMPAEEIFTSFMLGEGRGTERVRGMGKKKKKKKKKKNINQTKPHHKKKKKKKKKERRKRKKKEEKYLKEVRDLADLMSDTSSGTESSPIGLVEIFNSFRFEYESNRRNRKVSPALKKGENH